MSLPRLAITLGDPAGIGPEVVAKALSSRTIYRLCRPIVVGDRRLLGGLPSLSGKFPCRFVDIPVHARAKILPGRLSAGSGRAAYASVCAAAALIEAKEADALVTAPVSKEAINRAGIPFSGHTEMLAALSGTKDYAMLMVAGKLFSVMVTR
ncbi:MAG: 4-hydroxythreonine-4-phosphate dehydrogenase PdxA, partial [Endomicrobiales bacterium]